MRYLRVTVFMSAILVATSVFLAYVQLGVGGISFGQRTSMPLYSAVNDYSFVEDVVEKVDASGAVGIADAMLGKVGRSPLASDLRGVISDIRDVREQAEVETIGLALRIVGIVFLVMLAVVAWLVLKNLSQGSGQEGSGQARAKRSYWVLGGMTIIGVVSSALFVVVGEALALANEEIGIELVSYGSGAYMMMTGAIVGFVSALVCAVADRRLQPKAASLLIPK